MRNLTIDQESDRAIRCETLAKTDLVEVGLRGDKGCVAEPRQSRAGAVERGGRVSQADGLIVRGHC